MNDLIKTMREAINERVAGTAMIQACYLEAACEEIERLQAENAELKRDAAIGAVVWKFIDRMNDVAPECGDSAERILAEFVAAVIPEFNSAMERWRMTSEEFVTKFNAQNPALLSTPQQTIYYFADEVSGYKERIAQLERELAECKAYADNYKQEWQETLQEVLESRAALAAQVLQMRYALQAMVDSAREHHCGLHIADEALALDTKPAEQIVNGVKAQALRDLIPRSDWHGQIHISLVSHLADELESKCRKCGGNMIAGKAIQQTLTGTPDFPGDDHAVTLSPGGSGKLIDCLKCEKCGWSVTE